MQPEEEMSLQHQSKVTTSEEEYDEESIVRVTQAVKSRVKEVKDERGPVYVYEEEGGLPRMAGTTSGTYISNSSDWVKSTTRRSPGQSQEKMFQMMNQILSQLMQEFQKKLNTEQFNSHQFVTRGEMVEVRQELAEVTDQLQSFKKLISDLQMSVTERDAELIQLSLALLDTQRRSQSASPLMLNQHERRHSAYARSNPSRHVRNLSARNRGQYSPPRGRTRKEKDLNTSRTHFFLTVENQEITNLKKDIRELSRKLELEKTHTVELRENLERQWHQNLQNFIERRKAELETKSQQYQELLESRAHKGTLWKEEKERLEKNLKCNTQNLLDLRSTASSIKKEAKNVLQKHKENKEMAKVNIKLKEELSSSRRQWANHLRLKEKKLKRLQEGIQAFKRNLPDIENCKNCKNSQKERDQIKLKFEGLAKETEQKRQNYEHDLEALRVYREEKQRKLETQPSELEDKIKKVEEEIEKEGQKKKELEAGQSEEYSRSKEVDEKIAEIEGEIERAKKELEEGDDLKLQKLVTTQNLQGRVKQAQLETEEVRKENGRLKEQLAKDVTSIIVMKAAEIQLDKQVANLKKEIDSLKQKQQQVAPKE